MNIVHKIRIDLSRRGQPERIDVVQGDSMSRRLEIKLYNNGVAYSVPESASILQIAYCKPDKTCGLYDRLPNGDTACVVEGNVVTAILHPQMFTAAGDVHCELRMLNESGKQITTFRWIMNVAESVVNKMNSEDYYNFYAVSILSINGRTPNRQGEIHIAGEDIPANPAKIPDFEGTVDDALDRLAMVVFSPDLSGWQSALENYSNEDDVAGLPVLDTAGKKYGKMSIIGTEDEMNGDRNFFEVPTCSRTGAMIREAMRAGYIDVTEDYEKALAAGEVSCAREYLWTLGVGRWSLAVRDEDGNDYERFYLWAFLGEVFDGNGLMYRILINAYDFFAIELHNDDSYDSVPAIKVDCETGEIYSFGELLGQSGGTAGTDGSYYIPAVQQVDDATAKFSFKASTPDLPEVPGVTVTLPSGPQGPQGEKGPKGDTGEKGDQGIQGPKGNTGDRGEDGHTPVVGVDYFTEADKNEIVDAVKLAVPLVKTAEQPTFVNSVDKMTDTSKSYALLPEGYLYAYMTKNVSWAKTLTADDFEIGGLLSADGTDMASTTRARTALLECSEQIPVKLVCDAVNAKWLVHFFKDGTWLGKNSFTQIDVDNLATVWTTSSDVTHVRIAIAYKSDTAITSLEDLVGNFAITQSYSGTETGWMNTGLAYNQPADYEERIVALEKILEDVEYGSY